MNESPSKSCWNEAHVQFQLKTLLFIVTGAALAAAIAAPWVRSLDAETQFRLAMTLAIVVGATGLNFWLFALAEWNERKQAGECWKVIRIRRWWSWLLALGCGLPALMQVWLVVNSVRRDVEQGNSFAATLYDDLPMMLLFCYQPAMMYSLYHYCTYRFHEHGLVQGIFYPRSNIRSWRWASKLLTIVQVSYSRIQLTVPAEDHAEVEDILVRWQEANVFKGEVKTKKFRWLRLAPTLVFLLPAMVMFTRQFIQPPAPARRGPRMAVPATVPAPPAAPPVASP